MKKILLILTLSLSISAFAQDKDIYERIKALKIAHITEQLDLTEKEAQNFWPIYNANEKAQDKLRSKSTNRRKEKKPQELSEAEAKTLLLEMVNTEKEKQELHSKFIGDLLKVLPAKKIISLMQADRTFRHKMIKQFKERHRGDKRDPRYRP